jgi:hypothetical protein
VETQARRPAVEPDAARAQVGLGRGAFDRPGLAPEPFRLRRPLLGLGPRIGRAPGRRGRVGGVPVAAPDAGRGEDRREGVARLEAPQQEPPAGAVGKGRRVLVAPPFRLADRAGGSVGAAVPTAAERGRQGPRVRAVAQAGAVCQIRGVRRSRMTASRPGARAGAAGAGCRHAEAAGVPNLPRCEGALNTALEYIRRGWAPIPIPFREKRPVLREWPSLRISAEDAPRYFDGKPQNIGILLGTASDGLTDVDLDCAEARALAGLFLPDTECVFGRKGAPRAHYLYVTDLAETTGETVINFDDVTGERLLELRIGGAKGAQTIMPGSVHKETGEAIEWSEAATPIGWTAPACAPAAPRWPPRRSWRGTGGLPRRPQRLPDGPGGRSDARGVGTGGCGAFRRRRHGRGRWRG